jgi:Zn-dependent protease
MPVLPPAPTPVIEPPPPPAPDLNPSQQSDSSLPPNPLINPGTPPSVLPTLPPINPESNPSDNPGSGSSDSGSSNSPPGSDAYSQPQEVVLTNLEVPPPMEVPPPPEIGPPSDVLQSSPEQESVKSGADESPSSSSDMGADNPVITPVPTPETVLDTLRETSHNSSAMSPAAMVVPEPVVPVVAVTTGISLAMIGNFFMTNIDKLFSLKLFGFVRDFVGEHTLQSVDEYEAKKRKIVVRTGKRTILGLTHAEIAVAIIGSILIGVATVIALRDPISINEIAIYILAGGIAVTLHEFGHRYAAHRKNVATEVKFWELGAVTMFLTGWLTGNVFAQPQRTIIDERSVEEREKDHDKIPVDVQISLAGPLVNLAIALVTIPFLFVGGEVTKVASIMLMMTLLLAVFHLMPFAPMDGKAIAKWNKYVLAVILIPLIAVYSYLFLL